MIIVKKSKLTHADTDNLDREAIVLRRGIAPGLVRKPHIDGILADAYSILASQLGALRSKTDLGYELDREDVRKFVALSEALAKLAREEREQRDADRLDQMSDEELFKLAKDAQEALKKP